LSKPDFTLAQRALEKVLDRASSTVLSMAAPDLPQFGNWTLETLIDEAALLGEMEKRAKTARETLKGIIKTKLEGATTGRGDLFSMDLSNQVRYALKQDKAKAKLLELGGQAALDECMETTEVPTMRFRAL